MDCKTISPSRIELFLACPLRYRMKYHDKIPEHMEESIWAELGTCYHKTIEEYQIKRKHEDLAFDDVKKLWVDNCAHYSVAPNRMNEGVKIMEKWYNRFDKEITTIDTEQDFHGILLGDIPIHLIIDYIGETPDGNMVILDWKSGQMYSGDDMEENIQAPMYILTVQQLYPNYKDVKFYFDFLRFGPVEYIYSQESIENFKEYLRSIYNTIIDMDPEDAKPKFNAKQCGYCGYHANCPKMQEAIEGKTTFFVNKDAELESLISQRMTLQDSMKAIESYKKEIEKEIKVKLDMEQIDEMKEDNFTLRYKPKEYKKYDVEMVHDSFPAHLRDVLSVRKTNVDKLMSLLPDDEREALEDTIRIEYSSPALDIRRKKR